MGTAVFKTPTNIRISTIASLEAPIRFQQAPTEYNNRSIYFLNCNSRTSIRIQIKFLPIPRTPKT